MTKQNKQEHWEIDFDKKFYHEESLDTHQPCEYLVNNDDGQCNCQIKDIKQFISSLLSQARQEAVKEVIKLISTIHTTKTGAVVLKTKTAGIGANNIDELMPTIIEELKQIKEMK